MTFNPRLGLIKSSLTKQNVRFFYHKQRFGKSKTNQDKILCPILGNNFPQHAHQSTTYSKLGSIWPGTFEFEFQGEKS